MKNKAKMPLIIHIYIYIFMSPPRLQTKKAQKKAIF